jgi:hypothetical protein
LILVGHRHSLLQIDGALHGVDGAAELNENTVSGKLKNATLMSVNEGFEDFSPPGPEGSSRTRLVLLHQPAVADDIGGQYRGKAAFNAVFGHKWLLFSELNVRDCMV